MSRSRKHPLQFFFQCQHIGDTGKKVAFSRKIWIRGFQGISGQTLKHGFDRLWNGGTPVSGFGLKHKGRLETRNHFFLHFFCVCFFGFSFFSEPTTRQSSSQAFQKTFFRPSTIKIAIRASFWRQKDAFFKEWDLDERIRVRLRQTLKHGFHWTLKGATRV